MTARRSARWRTAAARAASAAALLAAQCGGSAAPPPNVLLLVMDTTRADRCSVSGGRSASGVPTTPSLERLAATGVTFLDAWAPGGWTAPAHASMFTGLGTERHRVDVGERMFLDVSVPVLAELLGDAGWETACFTNNENVSEAIGLVRGFGVVKPLYLDIDRQYPWCDATHEQALRWALSVRDEGGRFLLFVNDMEPHLPYTPPEDVARRFLPADATAEEVAAARAFDFPETLAITTTRETLAPRRREILTALYDAEIAALDASIGALLDRFRAEGLLDETLVIVCGDHGENLGDHGLMEHRFSLHRSIRRVPLVVRLPGRFDGGRTVTGLVRLEDVFPTVLEACGVPVPAGIDGRTLAGTPRGRVSRASWGGGEGFVGRMAGDYPELLAPRFAASVRAVTDGKLHYLERSDGRAELYDLTRDPAEEHDLAPLGGPGLAAMRRLLGQK